jgi:transposase-like protein
VEFGDFNHATMGRPMAKRKIDLSKLTAKLDQEDLLRGIAEAVLQLILEADLEDIIGGGSTCRMDGLVQVMGLNGISKSTVSKPC